MIDNAPGAMQQGTHAGGLEIRSEHTGDFLRLAQLWGKRTHFSLIFAACDNPHYRDSLIERLDAGRPSLRLELQTNDSPEDWLARLQTARQSGTDRVHTLLPPHPADAPRWWQQANVLRERLADAFPAPLLLWLTDADIHTAAHHAPDLWNWREAVFPFTHTAPVSLPALSTERFSAFSGGPAAQLVQQRLNDIQHYLQHYNGDPQAAAHLQLEAALAHERLGQWSESEAAARTAASAFQLAGNAQLAAQAKTQIADILQARGQLDEALRILSDEARPAFERLGDVHSKAVTMGKIADILQARGQPDEALRIRREEQLPAYERLGDVHSKAVTIGKIADILLARGQLGEALALWEADCLPVFERLGLQREAAISQDRIAGLKARIEALRG